MTMIFAWILSLRISNLRSAIEIAAKDNRGITPSPREDFRPWYEKTYLKTQHYLITDQAI